MARKIIFFACILVFFGLRINAQVTLQTGGSTFSLPMFSWQDNKSRLNAVVALNYNSGNGLKVSEIASNVGQGWNLIAGGVITRMQVGEPDDQRAYELLPKETDITKYPAGYLYGTEPIYKGCPNALSSYPVYGGKNIEYRQHNKLAEDKQLDYFSFQFNGKSGMFILDTAGNVGIPLGDTKLKITFQHDLSLDQQFIRTTITSFIIQDVDGLQYKFAKHGKSKVLQVNYCDKNQIMAQKQPDFKGGNVYYQASFDVATTKNPWVIGSWYLTEITDGLTNRKIILNYDTNGLINHTAGEDLTYNSSKNYSIVSMKRSISVTPELTSMVFPDGHTVTIGYGKPRIDLTGENAISNVDITYNGRFLSKYVLNTTYFILNRYGNPTTNFQKRVARLCLKSVQKIGVDLKDDSAPYIFDYYTGSNTADDYVPPPFHYGKDIWGFFNGSNSTDYSLSTPVPYDKSVIDLTNDQIRGMCYLRQGNANIVINPKDGYAKNGLLKQIIYPTGGTLTYNYEQNVGVLGGTTRSVGGVHVSQTSSTDGGFSNPCSNPIVTNYYYVVNGVGSASSIWGLEMPVNSMVLKNHYVPFEKKYRWKPSAIFGYCDWNYKYPGILSQQQAIDLVGFQKFMAAAEPVLGIISLVATINDVVTLCLGATPLAWIAVIVDIICGLISVIVSCTGSQIRDDTSTMYFNADLNAASPLPTQFKRVEVVESSGSSGKTVHEFTSDVDYAIWEPTNIAYTSKQRFANWAYGLPKKTSIYDVNNFLVKQSENIYDFGYAKSKLVSGFDAKSQHDIKSCKCMVTKSSAQKSSDWSNPTLFNVNYTTASVFDEMEVAMHGFFTGRVLLATTYERENKPNSSSTFVETKTDFIYNNLNNYELREIVTTKSNGDKLYKDISYTSDLSGGAITPMKNNNIVNLPVVISQSILKAGASEIKYLNERVTEFVQLSNGDVKVLRTIEQRFTQPKLASQFTAYSFPGQAITGYKILESYTYDANGNLIGIKDEGNRVISNIYDYNDKYVVASVINAAATVDKTAYSSFETANLGGWSLTGPTAYVTNYTSPTGSRYFSLTNGSNSLNVSGLTSTKQYILSFWSSAALTVSAGATLAKNAPVIGGFTYYEYTVTGATSITISGTGNIDELRFYPANARMRTTTYDEIIGKTSDCDENNRTTYYEYDKMARLQFEKDEYRNILKMYEYNSISRAKQNGCPGTYYSKLISEQFIRSNCSAGYQGGPVTFTVPANKYSSTISQQDADDKAEADILTNGQAYANIAANGGSCSLIYYNVLATKSDSTESCDVGKKGGFVTYTVPANRYSSIISQADADLKAQTEILANSQAYANKNQNCIITTEADWSWETGASYCLTVNGTLPAHQFIQERDINPNSPTYNQSRWADVGPQDACPAGTYYNAQRITTFNRNNCTGGALGSSYQYIVPPGKYSSTASQAAADQLAINETTSLGQAAANSSGTCCTPTFTWAVTTFTTSNFSITGSKVNFTLLFTYPGTQTLFTIGTINGSCLYPTANRTIPIMIGSAKFNVLISTTGVIQLQWVSGTLPSGTVAVTKFYDIFSNLYFNDVTSGTYTRNNCTGGQVGSSVTYTVAFGTYYSSISLADANQQAQANVTANGQSYANTNGTCTTPCTFAWGAGITGSSYALSPGPTTVNFTFSFSSPTAGFSSGTIGTISTGCRPATTQFLTNVADPTAPTRKWNITINTTGTVQLTLSQGTAPGAGVNNILNGTYNK